MGGTRALGHYSNNFEAGIKQYLNINAMIMMSIYKHILIHIRSNNLNVSTNYSWKTGNLEELFLDCLEFD